MHIAILRAVREACLLPSLSRKPEKATAKRLGEGGRKTAKPRRFTLSPPDLLPLLRKGQRGSGLSGPMVLAGILAVCGFSAAAASQELQVRGIVFPGRQTTLRSAVDAEVRAVHVVVGESVDAGRVLVELDAAAMARRRDAASALNHQAEAEAELARAALGHMRRIEEQLESELRVARQALEPMPADARFRRQMESSGDTPVMRTPLRDLLAKRIAAMAGRAETALVRLRMRATLVDELRDQLEEGIEAARVASRTAEVMRSGYAAITAPTEGTVSACPVRVGMRVAMGDEVVTLMDTRRVKILLWIPPWRVPEVVPRRRVEVRPDGANRWWQAEISTVSPLPEPRTRQCLAEVILDNREGHFQPGMLVDARLSPAPPRTDKGAETPVQPR